MRDWSQFTYAINLSHHRPLFIHLLITAAAEDSVVN